MQKMKEKEKLQLVLREDQMERLQFDGNGEITVDLHGMRQAECGWLLRTMITLVSPGQVHVIHGYNRGTKLKELIWGKNLSDRIANMSSDPWNPGLTHITVAAKY
jgi:hypothetical protein